MIGPSRIVGRLSGAILGAIVLSLILAACGSGDGGTDSGAGGAGPLVEKVLDMSQAFTFDDLLAAGFKKGKTYNVEGLEKAIAAYYGFYGLDPYDRQEYEVRFYGSHADAVEFGIPMADEVTGVDKQILMELVTWKEAEKEERGCIGLTTGSHHIHSCDTPKYADYVVRGNMILMCQGRAVDISQQHCKDVLDAMGLQ